MHVGYIKSDGLKCRIKTIVHIKPFLSKLELKSVLPVFLSSIQGERDNIIDGVTIFPVWEGDRLYQAFLNITFDLASPCSLTFLNKNS